MLFQSDKFIIEDPSAYSAMKFRTKKFDVERSYWYSSYKNIPRLRQNLNLINGQHYFIKNQYNQKLVASQVGDLGFKVIELIEVIDDKYARWGLVKVRCKFKYCLIEFCCCCGKSLDNDFSVQNGIGPVCVKKFKVDYRNFDELKQQLLNAAEALGTQEVWLFGNFLFPVEPKEFPKPTDDAVLMGLLDNDARVRELAKVNFVEEKEEVVEDEIGEDDDDEEVKEAKQKLSWPVVVAKAPNNHPVSYNSIFQRFIK